MNKRFLILLAFIICGVLLLASILIIFAQGPNLVLNPNFDDDSEWSWCYANAGRYFNWGTGGVGGTGCAHGQSNESGFCCDVSQEISGSLQGEYTLSWSEYHGGSSHPMEWHFRNCGGGVYDSGISPYVGSGTWQSFSETVVFDDPTTNVCLDFSCCYYGLPCAGRVDEISLVLSGTIPTPTSTPTSTPIIWIGNVCNLENYSFNDGLANWLYGDWVIEGPGFIELHGNVDTLSSWIAQPISLTTTGPSDYYELTILSRSRFPVSPEDAPFIRWKLDSQIPGTTPFWFQDQAKITSWGAWQFNSWVLRDSNSPAISDTLTIWAYGGDIQIDNVCITFQQGPASSTPICPPSPTYTPNPTYTPLPTPTPVTTATATAWAATATAWPTPIPYPTQAAPNCSAGGGNEPDWSFIWLMGQVIMFLGAFFEAIFRLLGTVLQPIFDLIGFVVWLLGAAFGLISQLIDLIRAALQFLISLLEITFDILEIIGAFFVALWNVISASPADPGFVIPSDWGWPIAAWSFLIEGTPLELLEPVAMGIGSLLMILWTIRQFSPGEG